MQLININEAATLSGKSIQTIRRMIKQKKITVRKQKTPQGFNYLVDKDSLTQAIVSSQDIEREHRPITAPSGEDFKAEAERFNSTIQKLIEQNERDKENFFQLIRTFQDRVGTLENQIKLLEAPKKRWWRFGR